MKIIFFALVIFGTFAMGLPLSSAKDCNCQQHSAGASGSGSCSLTEDSSR